MYKALFNFHFVTVRVQEYERHCMNIIMLHRVVEINRKIIAVAGRGVSYKVRELKCPVDQSVTLLMQYVARGMSRKDRAISVRSDGDDNACLQELFYSLILSFIPPVYSMMKSDLLASSSMKVPHPLMVLRPTRVFFALWRLMLLLQHIRNLGASAMRFCTSMGCTDTPHVLHRSGSHSLRAIRQHTGTDN